MQHRRSYNKWSKDIVGIHKVADICIEIAVQMKKIKGHSRQKEQNMQSQKEVKGNSEKLYMVEARVYIYMFMKFPIWKCKRLASFLHYFRHLWKSISSKLPIPINLLIPKIPF